MITGQVHRYADDIDTDVILPGRYLSEQRAEVLGQHCLEGLDPGFVGRVRPGDILAVGSNFGCGSSREHAVLALKAAGVAAIVAVSAARIFYRNAINLSLPVIIAPDAARGLRPGMAATIELASGRISQADRSWHSQPFPPEIQAILAAGGLVAHIRASLTASHPQEPSHG